MRKHGNSNENMDDHHLYEIINKEIILLNMEFVENH